MEVFSISLQMGQQMYLSSPLKIFICLCGFFASLLKKHLTHSVYLLPDRIRLSKLVKLKLRWGGKTSCYKSFSVVFPWQSVNKIVFYFKFCIRVFIIVFIHLNYPRTFQILSVYEIMANLSQYVLLPWFLTKKAVENASCRLYASYTCKFLQFRKNSALFIDKIHQNYLKKNIFKIDH